jgi:hypothetical protein
LCPYCHAPFTRFCHLDIGAAGVSADTASVTWHSTGFAGMSNDESVPSPDQMCYKMHWLQYNTTSNCIEVQQIGLDAMMALL